MFQLSRAVITCTIKEGDYMRLCTDYSYFHLGIAFGDIVGDLVLTIHLGFWSFEYVVKGR
jgi:hypothetical protein